MRTLEQAIAEADRKWARRRLWMTAAELIGIAVVAALLLFGCATLPQPIPMPMSVSAWSSWPKLPEHEGVAQVAESPSIDGMNHRRVP